MADKENLKRRAVLNSATALIDHFSKIILGFIINPIVISILGTSIYGVWQILNQFTNYTALANIRVSEVLKWSVAKNKNIQTQDELRSSLTSALILVLAIIPVFILLGLILVWYAPIITKVSEEYVDVVRITASLLVLTVISKSVFSIFESVLRGMNLGYKGLGIKSLVIVAAGVAKVITLKAGYGLIGLALVQLTAATLTGLIVYIIVKRNVDWFGFAKTSTEKTKNYLKLSGWYMAWMGVKMLLLGSDKVLMGVLLGPLYVAKYSITQYVAYASQGMVGNILHGVLPGIGSIYGQKQFKRLLKVRDDMMMITGLLLGLIGFIIIAFNISFANLWVGSGNYLGRFDNLLVMIMVTQFVFIQNDSVLINTMLDVKQKTIMGLLSIVITLIAIYMLSVVYGVSGFISGIITGRLILTISYPQIVLKKLEHKYSLIKDFPWRTLFGISIAWLIAYELSEILVIESWLTLVFYVGFSLLVVTPLLFYSAIERKRRQELIARVSLFNQSNND